MPPHEKSPKGGNPPGFVCFRLFAGVTKVALLIVATIVLSAKPRLKGHHTDLGMPLCIPGRGAFQPWACPGHRPGRASTPHDLVDATL